VRILLAFRDPHVAGKGAFQIEVVGPVEGRTLPQACLRSLLRERLVAVARVAPHGPHLPAAGLVPVGVRDTAPVVVEILSLQPQSVERVSDDLLGTTGATAVQDQAVALLHGERRVAVLVAGHRAGGEPAVRYLLDRGAVALQRRKHPFRGLPGHARYLRVSTPSLSARSAHMLAPRDPFLINARHRSAPARTISMLRRYPARRPCVCHWAGKDS